MAWSFGDGFDCYAATADAVAGYWDSGTTTAFTLVAGRFVGSQGLSSTVTNTAWLVKSSAVNDAVHHISVAYRQAVALTGTNIGFYFQLSDVATNQCCIVFRSDGTILLTSATPAGTVLATYSGAVSAQNTWFQFEFEVVINNTTGRLRARRNGNAVDDFDSGATLNTRPGANAYANKLTVGQNVSLGSSSYIVDDILWRSDAASVAWVGDIRCYTRMPAGDASVQFSRSTGATNFSCVDETLQNGATDYVFDSVVGHADLYTIAALVPTPAAVVAVTTRGFMQKSDAGAKSAAVQLKSGGTTVAAPTLSLATTFLWSWRTDTTNPAGGAWTPSAVDGVQVGTVVIA